MYVLVIIRVGTMTLAYEDGTSTIEGLCGASESQAPAWIAPVSDRPNTMRSAALAALAGTPISSRFCSWIGLSGRRYIFSVYPASDCPAFRDAVLLAVVRDMTGQRRAILARETGAFPEPVVAEAQHDLKAFGPTLELHLHLLATSPADRAAAVADLAIAQG
jgi:hypothetical protein